MRYLSLLKSFFIYSVLRELEFRGHFILLIIVYFGWSLLTLFSINIIYVYTNNLAGYSYLQALLVYGVFRLITGLFSVCCQSNLEKLSEIIRTGDLDFYLLKPVEIQFLVSFRYFNFSAIANACVGIFLIVFSISQLHIILSFFSGTIFLFLIVIGFVTLYSIYLMLMTLAFWLTRFTAISTIYDLIREPGRYPIQVLKEPLLFFFTFVVPVGIMFTFPAQFLTKGLSVEMIIISISISVLFFIISHKFFYYALMNYSSASS